MISKLPNYSSNNKHNNLDIKKISRKNNKQNPKFDYDTFKSNNKERFTKSSKVILGVTTATLLPAIGCFLAFKSGRCDKYINEIICNIRNISQIKNKIKQNIIENLGITKVRKYLQIKLNTIKKLDFTKARKHFHYVGESKNGQISGAHEIRECIQSLIKNNGQIYEIKPSSTQNGIYEIFYEINGKKSNTPKTIYIEKALSRNDKKKLNALINKHGNPNLKKALDDLIKEQALINESMSKLAEKALRNGKFIVPESFKNKIKDKAKALSELHKKLQKNENILSDLHNELNQKKEKLKNLGKSQQNKEERIQLSKEISQIKKTINEAQGKIEKISNRINKAKKEYEKTKSEKMLIGEADGRLFAAYVDCSEGKNIVNSYFPIANGSELQKELIESCLIEKNFSFKDITLLIGATKSQIEQYFIKIGLANKKAIMWDIVSISSCILIGDEIKSNINSNKLL